MKIAVIGIGYTKFGELWDKSLLDLLAESQIKALQNAQINPNSIDAIFTGNMCGESLNGQQNLGAAAADILNLTIPSTRIEAACASGGLALHAGISAIQSGMADVVLVNGVEKMTDSNPYDVTSSLMTAASSELEQFVGASFPALFALIARMYMHEFKLSNEALAQVSVKNHSNGTLNPIAHIKKCITIQDVLNSPKVADPLTLLDCSPMSDGAASIVLASETFVKKVQKNLKHPPVFITASTIVSDTLALSERESLLECKASRLAAQQAYEMAGIKPQDINLAEVHDAFSISELLALEDLGFCPKGQAADFTSSGKTSLNGSLPINTSGGLKSRGHPVGATGIAQVVEIVSQLRNECQARQIKNAKIGLTHNMGGIGSSVAVHIFKRED